MTCLYDSVASWLRGFPRKLPKEFSVLNKWGFLKYLKFHSPLIINKFSRFCNYSTFSSFHITFLGSAEICEIIVKITKSQKNSREVFF